MNALTRVKGHAKISADQADCSDQIVRAFRLGYACGREFEHAEAQTRVTIAEATADYWYFIARNPAEQHRVVRGILTAREIFEARAEQEREREKWDADERDAIERAKAMIWADVDDVTIATELGLYLPLVANLRAGVIS